MRGPLRYAFALLAALVSLGLAACGSSSSSSPAASDTAATRSAPPPAQAKKAGRAAPFVESRGDNSIPTYGAEAVTSQRSQAETALRAYLSARAGGDWAAACPALAPAVRGQLEGFAGGKGCPAAYKALSQGMAPSARANPLSGPLLSLRIKGTSAFALFYGPSQQKYVMPMAREKGDWKVTQLAPIAYPLGSETPASP